jgi:dipeptidyl aminopeptidase/acylaminoacyl peptidase
VAPPVAIRRALFVALALVANVGGFARQDDLVNRPDVREAQISPDGASVLFIRTEPARDSTAPAAAALWRVPFVGGDAQRMSDASTQESHPRWSPDGRQIALLSAPLRAKATRRVVSRPADSRAARAVTPETIDVRAFEWSPSGRRIAFVSSGSTGPALWVIDANGVGQRRLMTGDTAAFAWAPDDSAIARVARDVAGMLRVEVVAVDNSAPPRDIPVAVLPRVSWSRDGIASLSVGDTGPSRVLIIQPPSLTVRDVSIVAAGRASDVAWVGGGRLSLTLASNAESWIERLTIATGERIAIMPPGIATLTTSPSWSIDGNRYVVVGRTQSHAGEVFAGTVPLPETGRPDAFGARPPPVRRLTFSDR